MDLHITRARIIDPQSPHHDAVCELLIRGNRIAAIGDGLEVPADAELVDAAGACLSPGWFDSFAALRDPGYEYKEDLNSGADAAAAGGFTALAAIPDTDPVLHSKSEIEYVVRHNKTHPVAVHPMGAVSRERAGSVITEMVDMRKAGAIAFTEADKPILHAGLLIRALQYVKPFDGLIVNQPNDLYVTGRGMVHEGAVSTALGMPGSPAIAEAIMVHRDIYLADYTGSRLHFPALSTARSVELVREAKARGVRVTAGVAAYQLLLDDSHLEGYETVYKVWPPLRSRSDIDALIEGLADGTIDLICSNHRPQDQDAKKKEFELAEYGMSCLEVTFAAANTALASKLSIGKRVELLCAGPRRLFGLPVPVVEIGAIAEFTLFDPEAAWTPGLRDLRSRSLNNPFIGKPLKGRVLGIFNRGQWVPGGGDN